MTLYIHNIKVIVTLFQYYIDVIIYTDTMLNCVVAKP